MKMTKARKEEIEEARTRLREIVKPGDTVYCILRSVSRSGMQRIISLLLRTDDGMQDISGWAATATDTALDRDRFGLKMGGCGMDMGFAAVNDLSSVLFSKFYNGVGYECVGDGCPSNHHSNGDSKTCEFCEGDGKLKAIASVPVRTKKRLESLRQSLRAENISYGELAELQSLAAYIQEDDVELREAAGLPEDVTEFVLCPSCRGMGTIRVPAPRGAGVMHEDGYALRHSWL